MIQFNRSHKSRNSKKLFNKIIAICMLGFLFIPGIELYSQVKAKDKLLEGKTFQVTFTEQGKKKAEPAADEILFRTDKINSNYMLKENNFTASSYTATVDSTSGSPVISFSSDSKNADNDKLNWSGTIKGESIEGKASMTDKKGNPKKEYTFTGKLKVYRKK
jgi:hypothetical protein